MRRYKKSSAATGRRKQENLQQTTCYSTENGTQWTEKMLSTGVLYSGQAYQRPVKERVVDKLVREWDLRLLTALVVSYRDGRYYLVDGQHRVCACRKKNGGKDVDMLCRVYYGLTYEEEAELYYKLDQAKGHLRLAHATNDDIFIKRLSAVDPDEIIRRGKVDFSTNKAALRFARVIWGKYNGQQRGGRKLPYRFNC